MPYLARHFRVITFDARGTGRSDRPADPARYGRDVRGVVAVLDATGTDRALVAGLSLGAATALFTARGWGLDAGRAVLECTMDSPAGYETREQAEALVAGVRCPGLAIHGDLDRIAPVERGRRIAELTGGELVVLEGSGHVPTARDPVRLNVLIRDFATRVLEVEDATPDGVAEAIAAALGSPADYRAVAPGGAARAAARIAELL